MTWAALALALTFSGGAKEVSMEFFGAASEGLAKVRAAPQDLDLRPDRWATPLTIQAVDDLMRDPLRTPERAGAWADKLGKGALLSDRFALGLEILAHPPGAPVRGLPEALPAAAKVLPDGARAAVADILGAIRDADALVKKSLESWPQGKRRHALAAAKSFLLDETPEEEDLKVFLEAERFEVEPMLQAARQVSAAVERGLAVLGKTSLKNGLKWKTAFGDVIIKGNGNDEFNAASLREAALIVDLGGDNAYLGSPASAGPGEIRVVIDLGRGVKIDGSGESGTASGVFGVGLLYLPNPSGVKTVRGGDFSLGAGLFGAGGLFMRGSASVVNGGRFTQGAGAFGTGVMVSEGEGARINAAQSGQGFGFTRGAGLFRHKGGSSRIEGGLTVPDPHEAVGATSFCQGVGLGPRAFAGGGVGAASVDGNGLDLRASYMAQGMGYWRALGILSVRGDGNRLLARRYAQGAGVHAALGSLILRGHRNSLASWGAGPALGWDLAAGFLDSAGDDNSFSSEWGSIRGDVNGHGLAVVRGDRNIVGLSDAATGAVKRGAGSYGVLVMSGKENRLKGPASAPAVSYSRDPWGALLVRGEAVLDSALAPPPADWPAVPREEALKAERARLAPLMRAAEGGSGPARIRARLAVLAGTRLDGETAGRAAAGLFAETPEILARAAQAAFPERFNELAWIRLALAGAGRPASGAAAAEAEISTGPRKALLVGYLGMLPVEGTLPVLRSVAADPDWRVRRAAAGALGALFSSKEGEQPGRLRLLAAAEAAAGGRPDPEGKFYGAQRLAELVAVLSLGPAGPAEKTSLFAKSANPFDLMGPGHGGLQEFSRLAAAGGAPLAAELAAERARTEALAPEAREILLGLLEDPEPEVVHGAVLGLGDLGRAQDAPRLASFLKHRNASVREGAAAALGSLGAGAKSELGAGVRSPDAGTARMAALAAAQSSDEGVLSLLREALKHGESSVRAGAIAALFTVQAPFQPMAKEYAAELNRLAAADPSAEVRLTAAQAAARLK